MQTAQHNKEGPSYIALESNCLSAIFAYLTAHIIRNCTPLALHLQTTISFQQHTFFPQIIIGTVVRFSPNAKHPTLVNVPCKPRPEIHGASANTITVAKMLRTNATATSASPSISR
jgi:hypothetical protein